MIKGEAIVSSESDILTLTVSAVGRLARLGLFGGTSVRLGGRIVSFGRVSR
jgi:hypothetical protein